jgi:hypothetical protein
MSRTTHARREHVGMVIALILLAFAALPACGAARPSDALLNAYIAAVARDLDPRVGATLERIDGSGRRLLALRSYLRAGAELPTRWSWTAAEIRAYQGSAEERALNGAIARVRESFQKKHPGYTLFVQSAVRSLDVQIERWNTNASVAHVAASFRRAVAEQVQRQALSQRVTAESAARFAALVRGQVPDSAPTLAAPGLSRHGQLRAVDFIVRSGDGIVAGADSATLAERWERGGWSERLHAAVVASGAPFDGPLQQPPEPWHYEYRPGN